ncbi:MAG: nucleotide exchange factor GrpE [Desulfurellaceae bacterium]|nr:nucleotide exchange factor GrpE [Desulfurellaceae bacterium]
MERQGNGQPEEQEKTTSRVSGQTAFEGASEAANGQSGSQEQEGNQDELEGQGSEALGGVEDAEHDEHTDQDMPDELTLVRAQLVAQEALAKENYDLLLRERAELENFKRRMQREKNESLRFASEPLLRDILPVIDNLERAVAHAKGNEGSQALVEGVELVLRSLLDTIGRHGVSRVKAKGEAFDPSRHEAVAQVENTELAPNTVLDEHQSGYQLHDRLLRPAMVSVSKAAPQAQQEGEKESES